RPYLEMEYVEGDDLRGWLRRGVLPRESVIEIATQACAGLQAAHDRGVIHRDLKPEDIILSAIDGRLSVKGVDFGIAVHSDPAATEQSLTKDVIGTVAYMSPEQLQGLQRFELTPASDLYSLGLVIYELLTGKRVFAGASQAEIIANRLSQSLVPP